MARCYARFILGITINPDWIEFCSKRTKGLCCDECDKKPCDNKGCLNARPCPYHLNSREEALVVKMIRRLNML
jgi:hypothetical protein